MRSPTSAITRDIGIVVARHGAEQSALADAAAAEDSNALAFAARKQSVDRANAGDQWLSDVFAIERARRGRIEWIFLAGLNGGAAVDGQAESIQDAAEQLRPHAQQRVVLARNHAVA